MKLSRVPLTDEIRRAIAACRVFKGLTNQKLLAGALGISVDAVAGWEGGETKTIARAELEALAKVFGDAPKLAPIISILTVAASGEAPPGQGAAMQPDTSRGSPSSEPSLRAPHSDAAGAADVIAREIGQVIEAFIRMDEADGTKQGRAVIAEALEDFARCCRRLRPGVAVADLYEAALKLRRGEL